MKKVISILLCALFLYNIMGYYALYVIRHIQVETEMRAYIKSDEGMKCLQKLILSPEQFANSVNFIEEEEFFFNDQLYDLILKDVSGNSVIMYCYSDEKEEQLLETAKHFFNPDDDRKMPSGEQVNILEHMIKDFDFIHATRNIQSCQNTFLYKPYSNTYHDFCKVPKSPPPKIFS